MGGKNKNHRWQETQFFQDFWLQRRQKCRAVPGSVFVRGRGYFIFVSILKAWIYLNADGERSR